MLRTRPVMRSRSPIRVVRRRRRWQRVSWWYSLLLVVPLLFIVADWAFGMSPVSDDDSTSPSGKTVAFRITDASNGQAIAGADVRAGDQAVTSGEDGVASLRLPNDPVVVTVQHVDYEPIYGRADSSTSREQRVALRAQVPSEQEVASGDAGSDDETADQTEVDATVTEAVATEEGAPEETSVPTATAETGEVVAGQLTGTITDKDGDPIWDALVMVGDARVRTKKNGTFTLKNVPENGTVRVSASGYADQDLDLPNNGTLNVDLERRQIEAIYLTAPNAADPDVVDNIIRIANESEINAVVLDIKENYVWYDTNVAFFQDADAVDPTYDPAALVKKFHDNDIYVIARMVVFNDPIVAANRPDLAIGDDNGGTWKGADGGSWVDPFKEDLWQPNIDLALEAASLGFDEIQYDYIRFPSDGDLSTADFDGDYSEEGRVKAITDFLKMSKEQIEPTGAKLAVDVFGIVAVYGDDQGIGQRVADIAPIVDYVCPMVYPSHFDASSIDVGGEPNDFPGETIALSMGLAAQKMPGMELKLRAWLQDFDLGRKYTAEDVRAQIDATDESGASGWMLWNAANEYTEDALDPDS